MVNAPEEHYRAFDSGSSTKARQDALIDIAFGHAQTVGRVQQLQGPTPATPWSSIPFRVRQPVDTFLPRYLSAHENFTVLQPGISSQTTLIAKLQHEILSLWLRATQTGFSPVCIQFISSTHGKFFVRRQCSITRATEIQVILRLSGGNCFRERRLDLPCL